MEDCWLNFEERNFLNSEEYKKIRDGVIERWKKLGYMNKIKHSTKQVFSELDPYGEENWGE